MKSIRETLRIIKKSQDLRPRREVIKARLIEELGPIAAKALVLLIEQYPFREILNTPGLFFEPDNKALRSELRLSEATYRDVLRTLEEHGYLVRKIIKKKLMFEIQFEKLI
jgi:hypothetical protein